MPGTLPKAKASEAPVEGDELADAMKDLGEAFAEQDWSAAAKAFRRACTECESDYEAPTDEE